MKKNRLFSLLTLAGTLFGSNAMAQDSTSCTGKLTLSGSMDAYYQTLLAGKNTGNFGLTNRAFDQQYDQFAFNQFQTNLAYNSDKIEIVGQLLFGRGAGVANFNNIVANSLAIKQAYGKWKATDKLAFTVGQFGTHVGYELIDMPLNFHYSVSNLFQYGPYYHTGLKLDYAINDKFSVMAGLVNGWDNTNLAGPLFDNNKQKSFIGQLAFKPNETTYAYFNYIGGKEDAVGGGVADRSNTHIFDFVLGTTLMEKLSISANIVTGKIEDGGDSTTNKAIKGITATAAKPNGVATASWGGAGLYVSYKLNDMLSVGVRADHFEDYYGVRLQGGRINNSVTFTAPITLADGHFILKPEIRHDWNKDATYLGYNGRASFRQSTIGCAAIYKW